MKNDAGGHGRSGWFVAGIVSLILILDGFDMQVAAFAAPAIRADWAISQAALGPVLAAALIGLAIGTSLGGTLGDRFGRRPALLWGVVIFGAMGLACAFARNITELTILRLLTGIGLGVVFPNAVALVAESLPDRWRNFGVTITIVAIPFGGMIGAALSSWLVPAYGWRACFAVGGIAPLAIMPFLWLVVPESRQYGAADGSNHQSGVPHEPVFRALFQPPFARLSSGLWLALFGSMFLLYSYISWLPLVLGGAGIAMDAAIRGSLFFNLAGLAGSLAGSWLIAWRGSRAILLIACVLAIIGTIVIGTQLIGGMHYVIAIAGAMFAGAGSGVVQVTLFALAAHAYPPDRRARGIGWGSSVGRAGAILSAGAGGLALQQSFSGQAFIAAILTAIVVAVAGIIVADRHIPPRKGNPTT